MSLSVQIYTVPSLSAYLIQTCDAISNLLEAFHGLLRWVGGGGRGGVSFLNIIIQIGLSYKYFFVYCPEFVGYISVFRIHIHRIRIRIQEGLESGSGS